MGLAFEDAPGINRGIVGRSLMFNLKSLLLCWPSWFILNAMTAT
jgi:hypothetical protein